MTPRRSRARPILFLASADSGLRRRIRRSCSAAKWSWREFDDARELAEACREHRPALVLLDLHLPRVRLAALREACGASPIVVLGGAARVERALAEGAADGIACPCRPKLVLHRVRRALEHRATQDAVARMGGDHSHREPPLRSEGQDSLTGLPHRERILEHLADALAASRSALESVTVLFVDLEIGRVPRLAADPAARDHAIVALSERMRESVRERDAISRLESRVQQPSVARIGGEEFCILLPGLARPHDAYKVASRIQETLSLPLAIDGKRASISSNWGIAISPGDADEAQALLEAARTACRQAKQDGQERIRFFTAAVDNAAAERRALEAGLATVVERDELIVHYQPRVDLATNRICGFEALVRWRHPELGLVSPAKFIPIAEETGLIVPIGEHVLRTACAQNLAWQKQGLPHVRMSVNLSSVQFRDAALPATVAAVMHETGIDPEWVELELTESVLLDKAEATIDRLHSLRNMGLHLSIDDFGTGYSSLSYLKRFPIDALKIDQSFIREVAVDPGDAAITTSIVLLGKSLELSVVAEGVETRSQLSFLRVIQCHEAQGYLFSKPVAAPQAEALLTSGLSAELAA